MSWSRRKLDPDRILLMRRRQYSWQSIAEYFGVAVDTARCAVDPEHKAKLDKMRKQSEERKRHDLVSDVHIEAHREKVPQDVMMDRKRRLSIIPTINQAILGDPLPGRSALDRRKPRLVVSNFEEA